MTGRLAATPGAEDLRPLAFRVSDNKITPGLVNRAIMPVVKEHALNIQRGFVNGRQLAQNNVDLGENMRRHSFEHAAAAPAAAKETCKFRDSGWYFKDLPIGILFDFANAPTSVYQE